MDALDPDPAQAGEDLPRAHQDFVVDPELPRLAAHGQPDPGDRERGIHPQQHVGARRAGHLVHRAELVQGLADDRVDPVVQASPQFVGRLPWA